MTSYGYIIPGTDEWRMAQAVDRQVAAAAALKPLTDYRRAENITTFMRGAGSVSDAKFHAAYWTAVAARILRDRSLAARAANLRVFARAESGVPGSTLLFRGSAVEIAKPLSQAAATIAQAAGARVQSDPNLRAIMGILGHRGTRAAAAVQREARRSQSAPVQAGDALLAALRDAGRVAQTITPGVSPPKDMEPWKVWAIRGGVALAGLGVLAVVFRPYFEAGREATQRSRERRAARER